MHQDCWVVTGAGDEDEDDDDEEPSVELERVSRRRSSVPSSVEGEDDEPLEELEPDDVLETFAVLLARAGSCPVAICT